MSPLREGSLGAELAEGGLASVHAWGAGHAVVVPRLPARRTLPHHRRLLDGGAVRDELGDLPVHPVLGAEVGGRAGGELLVEDVSGVADGGALPAPPPVEARHLAVWYGRHLLVAQS